MREKFDLHYISEKNTPTAMHSTRLKIDREYT